MLHIFCTAIDSSASSFICEMRKGTFSSSWPKKQGQLSPEEIVVAKARPGNICFSRSGLGINNVKGVLKILSDEGGRLQKSRKRENPVVRV